MLTSLWFFYYSLAYIYSLPFMLIFFLSVIVSGVLFVYNFYMLPICRSDSFIYKLVSFLNNTGQVRIKLYDLLNNKM